MNSLLANALIDAAIASVLGSVAAILMAGANWLNARTRAIEVNVTLAEQQRQITHLATVQTAAQTAPVPAPIIINPPAAAPPSAAGIPATTTSAPTLDTSRG